MKKLVILFVLALGAGIATAQQLTASVIHEASAIFKWDEQTHDFGSVSKGKPVTHVFEFTNSGQAPLLITGVKASCGCTTPEWTKELIQPGATGFIKATYNASNAGSFSKTITVTSNVPGNAVVLTIKGVVE